MTQILCPFWCISIASVWSGFTEVRSVSIWVREISAMGANRYTKHIDEPVKVIPTPPGVRYTRVVMCRYTGRIGSACAKSDHGTFASWVWQPTILKSYYEFSHKSAWSTHESVSKS